MKSASDAGSNLVMVKLDDGEDLLDSLQRVVKEHRIDSGTVLWGVGRDSADTEHAFRPVCECSTL